MAKGECNFSEAFRRVVVCPLIVAGFFLIAGSGRAQLLPPDGGGWGTKYVPLNSWSFTDTNGWTSDSGTASVSFTNVAGLSFGDGNSLVVNSTNPAWVQYNVIETNSATNLTLDAGSIYFWFAPGWTSADQGGTGPGVWGCLIEVGGYTSDGRGGWWSLLTDSGGTNLYFMVQPGDGSTTTYLQAPISWSSNYWHCITLTYGATNTLYLDGALVTNGPGITAWPGTNATAGGFFIGSDGGGTGLLQAQGAFDDLYTYNVPLDSSTVYRLYEDFYPEYYLTPGNWSFVANIVSAPSNPSTSPTPDVITGQGNLLAVGSAPSITSSNFWLANVSAFSTNGAMALTFTIEGGYDNVPYDVFANSILDFSSDTNKAWAWMGQGFHGISYVLTGLPTNACFLILGGTNDADGDGLTDAYERLVSKTDPNKANSNLDGISDGWEILLGLNPTISNFTSPSQRLNYGYTSADWLNTVAGIKSGGVTSDNEGNVQSVSE
ncbi:MAG: hypothetical protein P4N59_16045 [Negativicutes bacterium]|nr:hypothetical protein [Negativicutes bacterium]